MFDLVSLLCLRMLD